MEIFRDLPMDLVEDEILTHVPARNLKGLGSTCKRWNRLFYGDRRFATKHAEKAAKQFVVLMLTRACRICPTIVDLDGKIPSFEVQSELSLVDPKYPASQFGVDIPFHSEFDYGAARVDVDAVLHYEFKYPAAEFHVGAVCHCDGLLLCTSADESRFVVGNPFTGETKWFEPSYRDRKERFFVLGYGKDKSYKVLSFYHYEKDYEIYEFGSDTWRVVDEILAPGWELGYSSYQVSLKGSTYWFAEDETRTQTRWSLVKFDYSAEKCVPVALPYESKDFEIRSLSVVKEEKLSVLLQREDASKTQVWVTNKIDDENGSSPVVSWSMVLALDLGRDLFWSNSGTFLLDEEKKVVMTTARFLDLEDEDETETETKDRLCIVGEDNQVTEVPFGLVETDAFGAAIFNYVPSLVQFERAGGERERAGDM
ncbi:unnamed protein product [Microthlaspi erraticum]|uniref:F-box associated beta-propeller type 1 domain-containing protein n=1 Tax=Microthlaspi erraticum TaxID=1685480 RepID=A0A6D2JTX8_9BRAS|nr:unnamed protein product [Microthlaspi erraticum]CAA7051720.1 unnamed protein product [Microthlaspi erraticum]